MSASRWSRVDDLYHAAIRLGSDERAAFLSRECAADPALRAEVESLLAEDDGSEAFLDEPALAVAARMVGDDIPVLTGRMLGPFRIESLLGAGGMGDVYRARDTVLGRDVAIKILPEAFGQDADRLARFAKEAQLLAQLSHPHVAAIYGIQEADGIRGLVLELVDGETLAERIARGPLPLYDAVRIARQIGEGLDAAHQRGIVHRDLKPSNIKIASDGTTKILDFGIATSTGTPSSVDSGKAPGTVLGTGSYMSPEQARGDIVDKRADIWAFGCVCFEMLTARAAFRHAPSGPLADPDWDAMPRDTPRGIVAALRRCLVPDVKHRRRDIGDVLADIDEALASEARDRHARGRRAVTAALMVALGATLGFVLWSTPRSPNAVENGARAAVSLPLPAGMRFAEQNSQLAVSPDGARVAYIATYPAQAPRLILRGVDDGSEQVIDAFNVRDPFFSPDGTSVGFIDGDSIRVVSLADGRSRVVCRAPRAESPSWGNGGILFGESGDLPMGGIRRVSADGGPVEMVTTPARDEKEWMHLAPQLLPDGRSVIYTVRRAYAASRPAYDVMVKAPGVPPKLLIENARNGRYVGDSVIVYQRERSLYAARMDLSGMTVSAPGRMLFNDLAPSGRPLWAVGGGLLVYRPLDDRRQLVWVGRDGREVSLPAPPNAYASPSLSPGGDRIAVEIDGGDTYDVWTLDVAGGRLSALTSDGASRYPMWTPDGQGIGVVNRRDNQLWVYDLAGGRRVLVAESMPVWIGSWTRNMRTLVYMQESPTTKPDLWVRDLQANGAARPLINSVAREYGGRVSPDGRWLAFFSDESGRFELYLAPFPAGTPRYRINATPDLDGDSPRVREAVWARNGRELFFRRGAHMFSVAVPESGASPIGPASILFEKDYFAIGGPGIVNYDVAADRRFLMLRPVDTTTPHLSAVQDWKRLVADLVAPAR